ncbi:hypothetical protein [Nocardioides terrisoli]|uniref:hypothetical protein n=1 Tax=Nocardioides terrisoli TaxID=3388267 RepID=UPI00287B7A31|nr:hypothetical protein [Nocardioides marmorisolisilvae]
MTHEDTSETLQAVVDRVTSYQDGATEGTVADELRRGLTEADLTLSDADIARLADAIEDAHGRVFAEDVLSDSR